MKEKNRTIRVRDINRYSDLLSSVSGLLETARRQSARAVNSILTVTYWEVGRKIVEFEQRGLERAKYGEKLLRSLASDLAARFGRGFSVDNLETMRLFYHAYPDRQAISETVSRKFQSKKSGTLTRISPERFHLTWSHCVMLVRRIESHEARRF